MTAVNLKKLLEPVDLKEFMKAVGVDKAESLTPEIKKNRG